MARAAASGRSLPARNRQTSRRAIPAVPIRPDPDRPRHRSHPLPPCLRLCQWKRCQEPIARSISGPAPPAPSHAGGSVRVNPGGRPGPGAARPSMDRSPGTPLGQARLIERAGDAPRRRCGALRSCALDRRFFSALTRRRLKRVEKESLASFRCGESSWPRSVLEKGPRLVPFSGLVPCRDDLDELYADLRAEVEDRVDRLSGRTKPP